MVTCGELKNACKRQKFNRFSPESYESYVSGRSSDLSRFNRLPESEMISGY